MQYYTCAFPLKKNLRFKHIIQCRQYKNSISVSEVLKAESRHDNDISGVKFVIPI